MGSPVRSPYPSRVAMLVRLSEPVAMPARANHVLHEIFMA